MPKLAKPKFMTSRLATQALLVVCLLAGLGLVLWPSSYSVTTYSGNKATAPQTTETEKTKVSNQSNISVDNSSQDSSPVAGSNNSSQTNLSQGSSGGSSQVQPRAPSYISASLSVNGAHLGNLKMLEGSNHCDLLKQALSEHVISQLTIKFNDSFKSYGVHQINDQGDFNKVWWVYEVNDKSPPAGCSGVTVKNGDSVNWKYLK